MRKQILLFPELAAALMLSACSSTATITEYNDAGKIVKVTETKEDLSKVITQSLKEKSVLILQTGWAAKIQATPADASQGGTANLEISIGSVNGAYSSIPAGAAAAAVIAEKHADTIKSVLQTELKAAADGVSGKTGASK